MENWQDYSFANAYISPGEQVLWRGRPEKGGLVTASDAFMIPFSIFWCGFAIFWEAGVLLSGAPTFMALFGIPFVLIGLYLVFGRFFHTAYMRKQTMYVITNRKIIRYRNGNVDYLHLQNMPPVQLRLGKNGCGTITFGSDWERHDYGYRVTWTKQTGGVFALENIPDAAKVHQIIATMHDTTPPAP